MTNIFLFTKAPHWVRHDKLNIFLFNIFCNVLEIGIISYKGLNCERIFNINILFVPILNALNILKEW